jgi:hypothetical protein
MTISVLEGQERRFFVWSRNFSRYSRWRGRSNEWHQIESGPLALVGTSPVEDHSVLVDHR